jgi:hypothetical protein
MTKHPESETLELATQAESTGQQPTPSPAPIVPIAGGPKRSELIPYDERGVSLRSMADAFIFAKAVITSGMAPKGFGTPEAVLVAIQFGAEVGLGPMASLQNIALINGRPALWGDAVPGVCQSLIDSYKDEMIGTGDEMGFRVTVKRKERAEPIVRSFTVAMAKRAGLWGKTGPWSQYPDRMLLMRARTFCLRDAFPDLLRGLKTIEELRDHPEPEKNVTPSLSDLEKPATTAAP